MLASSTQDCGLLVTNKFGTAICISLGTSGNSARNVFQLCPRVNVIEPHGLNEKCNYLAQRPSHQSSFWQIAEKCFL